MELRGWMGGVALALVSTIVACGDGDTGGGGGSGGQGTGGGTSSTPPKAAWSVSFVDGPSCLPGSENTALGQVTADARTALVTDGENEASVSCTVADIGSGFQVSAAAGLQNIALTFLIGSLPEAATESAPATGSVSYVSPNTAAMFTSADCAFYFTAGTPQGVQAGKVWLTFACPSIAAAVDNICEIDIGYAAFEGCSTEAE